MTLLEELVTFFKSIFHWFCYFVFFSIIFFSFGLGHVTLFGKNYLLPLLSTHSFSVQIFNFMRQTVLPPEVELITSNPLSAFVSQILLSLLLSFFLTIPLFLYEIIAYINPALLPHEKRVVAASLIPLVLLFFAGCAFSYFYLIPTTFDVLYPFATAMGASPLFEVNEFIQYVFGLMVGVGIMFLLPLFMILLSYLRIIKSEFWLSKWRFALVLFLILSAIITPDGTGVTMGMLFVPLTGLYFAGYYFAKRCERSG